MPVKDINKEVIYTDRPLVRVSAQDIAVLKEKALGNERRRIRLCAHKDVEDTLHEMLIVHTEGAYVRPHKHLGKSESFHVIEGSVDVVLFNEDGRIEDVLSMGEYGSGKQFFYRLNGAVFHSLIIYSPFLVFHETTNGPFDRSQTVFAPWAPEDSKENEYLSYQEQLRREVAAFKQARLT